MTNNALRLAYELTHGSIPGIGETAHTQRAMQIVITGIYVREHTL